MTDISLLEERDTVLQELVNNISTDFNKLDISDIVLRYFESKRKKRLYINPWSCNDTAVRQITSAKRNTLRTEYFRKVKPSETRESSAKNITAMLINKQKEERRLRLEKLRDMQMRALREEHEQQVARQLSFQAGVKKPSFVNGAVPMEEHSSRHTAPSHVGTSRTQEVRTLEPSVSARGDEPTARSTASDASQLSEVATELVNNALSYALIEREISDIAKKVVKDALSHSEVDIVLTDYVAELITDAVERAKSISSKERDVSIVSITTEERERIESIAHDIVAQVIEEAANAIAQHEKNQSEN